MNIIKIKFKGFLLLVYRKLRKEKSFTRLKMGLLFSTPHQQEDGTEGHLQDILGQIISGILSG